MQLNLIANLSLILPEFLIAFGSILVLMIGLFSQKKNYHLVSSIALCILIGAVMLLIFWTKEGSAFNDALIIDAFSRFMKILTLISTFFVLFMSVGTARMEKFDKFEFPVLILLATLGMMVMISAGTMLSLYLGVELQSLALYVLAAIRRDDLRSTEAGLKYFVLGALSSGMLLYGISLIYGYTGHIVFMEIKNFFENHSTQTGALLGIVFVLAGLSFKISAVPFHMWTPDVYEGAPTPVTAFFASAPKVAAIALVTRLVTDAFDPAIVGDKIITAMPAWQQVMIFISVASMLLGAFAGISQHNIKRLMAYSSIAHMGYALVGLCSASVTGVQSVLIYMVIYIVMTLGCFAFILGMNNSKGQIETLDGLSGLARKNLLMGTIMTVHLFSLVSIPPFAGFVGKWYTFSTAISAGLLPLAIIGMFGSIVAAFYYIRMIKLIWFDASTDNFLSLPLELRLVLIISVLFILFYLPLGRFVAQWAELAAYALF